jgi:hypothetical protein
VAGESAYVIETAYSSPETRPGVLEELSGRSEKWR